MDWIAWLRTYPLDALPYEVGFLLLAISLFWYSIILKKLTAIIREKPVWILPFAGACCLLVSIFMHAYAYLVLIPQMDWMATVEEINQMTTVLMRWRTGSLSGILLGGALALVGGGIYYRWTSR